MQQTNLFDETTSESPGSLTAPELLAFEHLPDGQLSYFPQFLQAAQADQYLRRCLTELQWREDQIRLYGKLVKVPRLTAWHGDPGARYSYSGLRLSPAPWTESLQQLRDMCQRITRCQFNSVLANLYRDGQDSMGLHADDEAELGAQPVIATISLGVERKLKFRHRNRRDQLDLNLAHGSLLVMAGDTQNFWQHGISKTKKAISQRVSLTFRRIYR